MTRPAWDRIRASVRQWFTARIFGPGFIDVKAVREVTETPAFTDADFKRVVSANQGGSADMEYRPFVLSPDGYTAFRGMLTELPRDSFTAERHRIVSEFKEALPSHLQTMFLDVQDFDAEEHCHYDDQVIDELVRHLPGVAPAIRTLYGHINEQRLSDVGNCCTGRWAS